MRTSLRYSSWLVIGGIILLFFGIFRSLAAANQPKPEDDVIVVGEVVNTLPVPQSTQAPLGIGGALLPDISTASQEQPAGIEPKNTPVIPTTKAPVDQGEGGDDIRNNSTESSPNKVEIDDPDSDQKQIPTRILIPSIGLDATIVPAKLLRVKVNGYLFDQWAAPDQFAAGWHTSSAGLGRAGNTVLNGHHNDHGEVFRYLINLKIGDNLMVFSGQNLFTYTITNILKLQEVGVPLEQRMLNSRWIAPSTDERITLVTCWPYESNTHRLVIVASPTP